MADSQIGGLLAAMKTALLQFPGLKTCKVGLEENITADDYPMARIVPTRLSPARTLGRRRFETLVIFGTPIHEFEEGGLETLYDELLTIEEQIIALLGAAPGFTAVYLDTIMDEDRTDVYKLMALRFDVEG